MEDPEQWWQEVWNSRTPCPRCKGEDIGFIFIGYPDPDFLPILEREGKRIYHWGYIVPQDFKKWYYRIHDIMPGAYRSRPQEKPSSRNRGKRLIYGNGEVQRRDS